MQLFIDIYTVYYIIKIYVHKNIKFQIDNILYKK